MPWIESLFRDLRFSFKQLIKHRGFSSMAILVFALGLAVSTAIFAFVDAGLITPLPYRQSERLLALYESIPVGDRFHISDGDYHDFQGLPRSFSSVAIYETSSFTVKYTTGAEQLPGARVSDGFFRTLGVVPMLGRDFRAGEDKASAEDTIMLSYAMWQKRYGADKGIVGRTTTLNDTPFLVIGVLPPDFHFAPVEPAGFWATTHGDCEIYGRACHRYYAVARLQDGTSIGTARADLKQCLRQIEKRFPVQNRDRSGVVYPLSQVILGDVRPVLLALLGGAALLLMIGLLNVSSLILIRAESRRREVAVRGALGATRFRLARQFAAEALLLTIAGIGIGLSLGLLSMRLLIHLLPLTAAQSMPYLHQARFTPHVWLFAAAVSLLAWGLFVAVPSLQLLTGDLAPRLADGGRGTAGRSWRRVGRGLVIVELSVAMVLLVSAGLLGQSFYRLLHVDIGIEPDHLASVRVIKLGEIRDEQSVLLAQQLRDRLKQLPGVTAVGISQQLVVADDDNISHYHVFGKPYLGQEDEANDRVAGVGFFETVKAKLLAGRYFTEQDNATQPHVAIINKTMATQAFGEENPLGQRIVNQYYIETPLEVIGVISDIREGPLDAAARAAVYIPFAQNPYGDLAPYSHFYVTVRTVQPEITVLHAITAAVREVDADLVVDGEETMTNHIGNTQAAWLHRSAASLVSAFGSLALALGSIGLYGVTSYSVGQRTREIGVRMALGAQRSSIYSLVIGEATWLAVIGVVAGGACSLTVSLMLRSVLFGVRPWDVRTIMLSALVLATSAMLASYAPSRRAASTNPTEALRAE
jgi:macrolide transport system ATP-binding/permease protein